MAKYIKLILPLLFLAILSSCASKSVYNKEKVYSLCKSSFLSIAKASNDSIRFTFLDTDICSYNFIDMGDNRWAIHLALGKFEKFEPNIGSFAKSYIKDMKLVKNTIVFNTLRDGTFVKGEKSNIFYFKMSKEYSKNYNTRLGVVSPSLNKHPAKPLQPVNIKKNEEVYIKPMALAKKVAIFECLDNSDILFRAKGDGAFIVQSGRGYGTNYFIDFIGIESDKNLKISSSCLNSKKVKIISKEVVSFPNRLRVILSLDTTLQLYPFSLGDTAGLATKSIGANYLTNIENSVTKFKDSSKITQRIKVSFSKDDFNIPYIEEHDENLVIEISEAIHLTGYPLIHNLGSEGIIHTIGISYSSSDMVLAFDKKLPRDGTIITYDKVDNDLYIYLTNK